MELWDAYDDKFNKIEGVTLVRGEEAKIEPGVYHLVCDILVKHVDGTYLLMQRDPRKAYANMWEATAGGSALQGETPLECAIRELREETGIVSDDLKEVGRVVSPQTHSVYVEFLCETDCDKESIILQEGETVAYRWITRQEFVELGKKDLLTYRMQRFVDELRGRDLTVPCDTGLINIRVCAIIMKNGKVLMAGNKNQDYLYTVGGRVQFGETSEDAIIREVSEETGMKLEIDRLGFIQENFFWADVTEHIDKLVYEIDYYYYMKVPEDFEPVSKTFMEGDNEEFLRWVSPDEDIKMYPKFFRTELKDPSDKLIHIITDERKDQGLT